MKIDNFKVEDWFNKYEKISKYDMADTCVGTLSLKELFNITGESVKHLDYITGLRLNYGDIQGSECLKSGICSLYDSAIGSDNIVVTHGAIGANQLVMLSVIEPYDKVVSILPVYQQHYSIPESIGAKVERIFLHEENGWLPDMDELRNRARGAKIICMNNPNNPTGAVMPESMLKEIARIAGENNSYVLCDEVYRGLEHDGKVSKSIAELYDKGISTGSMSKVFSLAGLRLGWIATPDGIAHEIMKQVIIHREYNTISIGRIDDYLAAIALENKDKIIRRNLDIIRRGKQIVSNWIDKEHHFSWVEPKGGTCALLKYDFEYGSYDMCKKLSEETGVLFLPASALEMDGYLRIGYCGNTNMLKEGLEIFSDWAVKNCG
ncbi:MAG: aminotransferase class I/II-fold pyridoxal phosphate-dependent enzyme [Candidatus Gastranaerophilales bacterium]|nr:aminotransferase class I/II-fold pyridoxal phosphate-dependent enzyme [Candidatus Gastranaerophilales bacterium]